MSSLYKEIGISIDRPSQLWQSDITRQSMGCQTPKSFEESFSLLARQERKSITIFDHEIQ